MSNLSGACWQVTFLEQIEQNEQLLTFLEEFFDVLVCNYDDNDNELYVGYVQEELDEKAFAEQAKLWNVELPEYKCEFIPATNWLTKNVIEFDPIETKDFLIYGSHEEQAPKTDKFAIKIYAATAFGSGQHQTTNSCLELLSLLKENGFEPKKTLDMGCGSGILAIGACKLWNDMIALAADIDEEAVVVTLQNANDNNESNKVIAIQSNGYDNMLIAHNAPYDLILANILARPLIDMAQDCANNLNSGGYAILSGFIDEQVDWVVNAHVEQGLSLIKIFENQNWRAVLMKKG